MARTRIRIRRSPTLVVGLLLAAVVFGACGGDSDDSGGEAAAVRGASGGGGGANDMALEADMGSRSGLDFEASAVPSVSDAVIKDARLELKVPSGRFEESVQRAETLAAQYGGFVFSTSVADAEAKRGTVVIRIPSTDFEQALRALKEEGELESQHVTGRDVSEEFIDLRARIGNLVAQETVILRLMNKATTVGQTIRIQSELSDIQLEIEQLKGRMRFLEDRTSFGTIAVTFVEEGAPVPKDAGMLSKAWDRAGDATMAVIAALIVALGFVFPLAVLGAVVWFVVRLVRKPAVTGEV